jgi:transcriptional regulator with XRE-family HTH domain
VTPFGHLLRRERQERKLLLGDLAARLAISVPYLSQLETGKRFVPEGFEEKIVNELSLAPDDANALRRAAAQSRSQYTLTLGTDADPDDRALAYDLAECFARLAPETKRNIHDLIRKGVARG